MNYNPITILIGQVLRHLLTMAAGLLAAYGVTVDQQTALVDSTLAVMLSVIMFLIGQGWSYFSKVDAYDTPTS